MNMILSIKSADNSPLNSIAEMLTYDYEEVAQAFGKRLSFVNNKKVSTGFGDEATVEVLMLFENCSNEIIEQFQPIVILLQKLIEETAKQEVEITLKVANQKDTKVFK